MNNPEKFISVEKIDVKDRKRELDKKSVEGLAKSMNEIGLLHPITVAAIEDRYVLVAGNHRLEAAKKLGWKEIKATIVAMDAVTQEIIEIEENLHRSELSEMEKDEQMGRLRELYKSSNRASEAFTLHQAGLSEESQRTIQQRLKRKDKISQFAIREIRKNHPDLMNNNSERDALARLSPGDQIEALERLRLGTLKKIKDYSPIKPTKLRIELEIDWEHQTWKVKPKNAWAREVIPPDNEFGLDVLQEEITGLLETMGKTANHMLCDLREVPTATEELAGELESQKETVIQEEVVGQEEDEVF